MIDRAIFDLSRLSRLADLQTTLRNALPPQPRSIGIDLGALRGWGAPREVPGQGGDADPGASPGRPRPALRDRLARLAALKPSIGLCEMGPRGPLRSAVPVPEGARFESVTYHGAAGTLDGKLYVPSTAEAAAMPLVVMLHGCTQSPDDFAAGTRMNDLAEVEGCLVLYPRQTASANAQKCWNWFDAKDQNRDRGEPALIAGLTRDVLRDFPVDPSRVYVAGLSAGGAAAAIMAQCYPDLYAAAGVHSGLARGAARDMPSAFAAMRSGGRAAAGRAVPTIVFQGDADRTVHPANRHHVIAQGRAGAALTAEVTRGTSAGGMAYTRTVERDAAGTAMLELWDLHGVGHAWSGGNAAGSYTEPRGPEASREMLRFFLAHRIAEALA